jgi:hypothetical protein
MPNMLVHGFEEPWVSSDPTRFGSALDPLAVAGQHSLRLTAASGAQGATASYTPASPTDLTGFDELRFWLYADQVADGSTARPFLLELGYDDAGDTAGDQHRWVVPVTRPRAWEQHRIGLAAERRSAITRWSLGCHTDRPFRALIDDLLAVTENPLHDVEVALVELLDAPITLPGVTSVPVQPAAVGATTLTVELNPRFRSANRIVVESGASPGDLGRYSVTSVSHDAAAGTTALTVDPATAVAIGSGATVSVTVPIVVEEEPQVPPVDRADLPDPVLLLALTDQREEPERGWNIPQRDSFRVQGAVTVCSVRPPARPVLLEYQVLAAATDREQSLTVRGWVLGQVGVDTGLRVNGTVLPVRTLLPPPLTERDRAVLAPIYLHIGTRVELGARREVPWVRHGELRAAPLSTPDDQEGIVLRL